MTTKFRFALVSAAAAALLMPFAAALVGAAPASAISPRPHDVGMYKVEKFVNLSGEYPDNIVDTTLACYGGSYALDGMWRVDHVDQAQPPDIVGDERDVYVMASYGDAADPSTWHFRIKNFADGDAQVHLFLTCIRGQVEEAYGHSHGVTLTGQIANTASLAPGAWEVGNPTTCGAGQIVVAPGFNLADDTHKVHLYRSYPGSTYTTWRYGFNNADAPVNATLSQRCLSVKTTPGGGGGHVHNLMWAGRPIDNGYVLQWFDTVGTQERRVNCDDGVDGKFFQDYKAMVGVFYLQDPAHQWFLGMDPRPKQRAYKFWWDGSGSNQVYLDAMCIRTRTSKQLAP